MLTRLEGFLFR